MKQNFDQCLEMLLEHEGGYVNHPADPGGETNLGVTKRVFDAYYTTDASTDAMKGLTVEDVKPIYRDNYWAACSCEILPSGVDWAVFDYAVNAGTRRAAKCLQKAVGATEDGHIGPKTLEAVDKLYPENIINRIAMYREQHYRSLSTFSKFGKGWLRRNDKTRQQAVNMITRG
jgi:lysozyme family protein